MLSLPDSLQRILNRLKGEIIPLGDLRLWPFRTNELPAGWYACNGDTYLLTSVQGLALQALSTNYKTDWGISIVSNTINVPDMFYEGRGVFLRAVNGSSRQVGSIQQDAIRNIIGRFMVGKAGNWSDRSYADGAFTRGENGTFSGNAATESGYTTMFTFNASTVVATSNENRSLNAGMTAAIFLNK